MTFVIDFNQLARAAKLIAVLGFFLPWVTVSCSGTDIMTATGLQLMTGDPQPAGPFANMSESRTQMEDAEPSVIVIAAFAAVLLGLVGGLLTRARTAATTMLAAAVIGAGLTYFSIADMRAEMRREIESSQSGQGAPSDNPFFDAEQQRNLSEAVASSVEVEEEEGYWLTLIALLAAAMLSAAALAERRAPTASAPPGGASG